MEERDYKLEYEILMAMTPEERKVHFLTEMVESQQYWLEEMLTDWRDERSVTMKEVRQQRKDVQKWAKRLNAAKQKLIESEQNAKPSQSSSHSAT